MTFSFDNIQMTHTHMLHMLTRWHFIPFSSSLQALHGSRRTEREAKAETHPDHLHQRPAEGAGAGFCWNALPGHLHKRRAGSQNRSDWSQSAGTQLPAPVTHVGGTQTAHWRISNGTILTLRFKQPHIFSPLFAPFLVKALLFWHGDILAPQPYHLPMILKRNLREGFRIY